MKLWLDDCRPAPPGYAWAMTADEAVEMLRTGEVTHVSLDHDLGTVATGYDVAVWIERAAYEGSLPELSWAVHSMNPVGAARIRQALENADRLWFSRNPNQQSWL